MEQKRRKWGASLWPGRAFGDRQPVPVSAYDAEDRTAQFKFEGVGAVAPRFGRDAKQRPAQCRIECRTEDLAFDTALRRALFCVSTESGRYSTDALKLDRK